MLFQSIFLLSSKILVSPRRRFSLSLSLSLCLSLFLKARSTTRKTPRGEIEHERRAFDETQTSRCERATTLFMLSVLKQEKRHKKNGAHYVNEKQILRARVLSSSVTTNTYSIISHQRVTTLLNLNATTCKICMQMTNMATYINMSHFLESCTSYLSSTYANVSIVSK